MTEYIEIGRIGGIQSAFSADTRNLVRCEAGRVLETAILVLVSRKGGPFSRELIRGRMTAARNDCFGPLAVGRSTFPRET